MGFKVLSASGFLLYVGPRAVDPLSDLKLRICARISGLFEMQCVRPVYNPEMPNFNLPLEKERVKKARLALVDLSFERPSVYYELSMIEILKVPAVLVAASGTTIHQTSQREDVAFFKDLSDFEKIVESRIRVLIDSL